MVRWLSYYSIIAHLLDTLVLIERPQVAGNQLEVVERSYNEDADLTMTRVWTVSTKYISIKPGLSVEFLEQTCVCWLHGQLKSRITLLVA
jgi:hypothetical protein